MAWVLFNCRVNNPSKLSLIVGDFSAERDLARQTQGTDSVVEQPKQQTLRAGFYLLLTRSVLSRVLSPLSQIVMARMLAPQDFGLIGMAYTVTAITALLQTTSIKDFLVRRASKVALWSDSAFSFALSVGVCGSLFTVAAGHYASVFYREPSLFGLVACLSFLPLVNSLSVVPAAHLQANLLFKKLFLAETAVIVVTPTLGAASALAGLGAYSFVIPQVVAAIVGMILYWKLSERSCPKPSINFRKWRTLGANAGQLLFGAGLLTISGQTDRMILGKNFSAADLGIYVFAFTFAAQLIQFVSGNVVQLTMTALSRYKELSPEQSAAFIAISDKVMFFAVPLCYVQAALAEPLVILLFGTKWIAAVPIVQILCVGVAFDISSATSHAAVRVQRRYSVVILHGFLSLVVFSACGTFLATLYGVVGMACAFAINFATCSAFLSLKVGSYWSVSIPATLKSFVAPHALCAVSAASGYTIAYFLILIKVPGTVSMAIASSLALIIYIALLSTWRPEAFRFLSSHISRLRKF